MSRIILLLSFSLSFIGLHSQDSIYDILTFTNCPGIEVSGEPELYVGDDLFSLINGEAELYHEYGFVEVLATEVTMPGGDNIKLEIYDMGSTEAAWGIFSMTATNSANSIDLGDKARIGSGFLQYIKGEYMIYIYNTQLEESDLIMAASCIANNIQTSSLPPKLMKVVETDGREANKILYFHGNLGLSNVYNFHYKDVFGYSEGAAAIYSDLATILLKYPGEGDCIEHFNAAKDFFTNSSKYHDQYTLRGSFHMKDRKEQQIDCYIENNYLIIFIYNSERDLNDVRERIIVNME